MDCTEAVGELARHGARLSDVQADYDDPMLKLFSALGIAVRRQSALPPDLVEQLRDLVLRIKLRPGSQAHEAARLNVEKLAIAASRSSARAS